MKHELKDKTGGAEIYVRPEINVATVKTERGFCYSTWTDGDMKDEWNNIGEY